MHAVYAANMIENMEKASYSHAAHGVCALQSSSLLLIHSGGQVCIIKFYERHHKILNFNILAWATIA